MTLKEQAAIAAADLVESGMKLGLGTGSTAVLIVRELGRRLRDGRLRDLSGVPTSEATAKVAREENIPLFELEETTRLDLALDGADEVDPEWQLIKGAGGSLLREKIVAQAATLFAVVVDESKLVDRLGSRMPLPLEVVPFGWASQLAPLRAQGGEPTLRLANGSPFLTDEGNYTLDVRFTGDRIARDPHGLARELRARAGVVETGLFLDLTSILVVGSSRGVETRKR
ncbi:MAG: ribose-5-phosphate isomerase RpiA [Candidatus Eisenbacteria bacterium]